MYIAKYAWPRFMFSQYKIHNKSYLIPEAPKKPLSNFFIFSQEMRQKLKEAQGQQFMKSVTKVTGAISEKWNKLTDSQKKIYTQKHEELKRSYDQAYKEYESKYILPFKKATVATLLHQKLSNSNYQSQNSELKGLKLYHQKLGEQKSKLTEEDKKKLQEEAQKINEKNQILKAQYKIPMPKYHTFRAFMTHLRYEKKKQGVEIPNQSQMKSEDMIKYKEMFEKENQIWKEQLTAFAKKYGISVQAIQGVKRKDEKKQEKITLDSAILGKATKTSQVKQQKKKLNSQFKEEYNKLKQEMKLKMKEIDPQGYKKSQLKKEKAKQKKKASQKTTEKKQVKVETKTSN